MNQIPGLATRSLEIFVQKKITSPDRAAIFLDYAIETKAQAALHLALTQYYVTSGPLARPHVPITSIIEALPAGQSRHAALKGILAAKISNRAVTHKIGRAELAYFTPAILTISTSAFARSAFFISYAWLSKAALNELSELAPAAVLDHIYTLPQNQFSALLARLPASSIEDIITKRIPRPKLGKIVRHSIQRDEAPLIAAAVLSVLSDTDDPLIKKILPHSSPEMISYYLTGQLYIGTYGTSRALTLDIEFAESLIPLAKESSYWSLCTERAWWKSVPKPLALRLIDTTPALAAAMPPRQKIFSAHINNTLLTAFPDITFARAFLLEHPELSLSDVAESLALLAAFPD